MSSAEALTPPRLIPIVVVPVAIELERPAVFCESLIVATWGTLELQCPDCVTSCVVPSLNTAVAVNAWVIPSGIVESDGLMATETGTAAVTVTVAELLSVPAFAVMIAVPMVTVLAIPVGEIVTVEGVSLDQAAVFVRSWVVLSLNVAATVNCCDVPSGRAGFAGVIANETIMAELTVSVLDPVTDPELAVMVVVP